jgi:chloramphenicol 3-O-phosphotransferase
MSSTIIFLNGTSSSGKTRILKALQDELPEPFLDMGIDRFIFMMPNRYLNRPHWEDVLGKAVQAGTSGMILFSGMHHAIATAAQQIMERLKAPPQAFRQLLLTFQAPRVG